MPTRTDAAAGAGGPPGTRPFGGRGAALRPGFGLFGPRHGRHTLSADDLDGLALPIGDDGVVVGVDAQGQPAVLGLSRPTPYDVVLIGGLWTAQVLTLRAAATGARVAVEAGRPQAWTQMVHARGGGPVAPRLVLQARLWVFSGCRRMRPRNWGVPWGCTVPTSTPCRPSSTVSPCGVPTATGST